MGVAEVWQKPSTSACYCYVTKVGQVLGHVEPTTDNVTLHTEETDSKTIMDLGMDGWDTKPPPSQNNTVFFVLTHEDPRNAGDGNPEGKHEEEDENDHRP